MMVRAEERIQQRRFRSVPIVIGSHPGERGGGAQPKSTSTTLFVSCLSADDSRLGKPTLLQTPRESPLAVSDPHKYRRVRHPGKLLQGETPPRDCARPIGESRPPCLREPEELLSSRAYLLDGFPRHDAKPQRGSRILAGSVPPKSVAADAG